MQETSLFATFHAILAAELEQRPKQPAGIRSLFDGHSCVKIFLIRIEGTGMEEFYD